MRPTRVESSAPVLISLRIVASHTPRCLATSATDKGLSLK